MRSVGKRWNIAVWVLQIVAALEFLVVGIPKLAGTEAAVRLFEHVGFGQWLRVLTGALEVSSAIALLVPRAAGWGALLLSAIMIGAIMTHLFIFGDSKPILPAVLLLVTGITAWARLSRRAGNLARSKAA